MGLLAGINASLMFQGKDLAVPPPETAMGSLVTHLTQSDPAHFQPSNVTFGLFPELDALPAVEGKKPQKLSKQQRGEIRAEKALSVLDQWITLAE